MNPKKRKCRPLMTTKQRSSKRVKSSTKPTKCMICRRNILSTDIIFQPCCNRPVHRTCLTKLSFRNFKFSKFGPTKTFPTSTESLANHVTDTNFDWSISNVAEDVLKKTALFHELNQSSLSSVSSSSSSSQSQSPPSLSSLDAEVLSRSIQCIAKYNCVCNKRCHWKPHLVSQYGLIREIMSRQNYVKYLRDTLDSLIIQEESTRAGNRSMRRVVFGLVLSQNIISDHLFT